MWGTRVEVSLLVQLRRRTSRPYSLELEHADASRSSIRCCLERRASRTPLASKTYTTIVHTMPTHKPPALDASVEATKRLV